MASSLLVPDGRRGTSTAGSVGRMLSFKASGGSAAGRARQATMRSLNGQMNELARLETNRQHRGTLLTAATTRLGPAESAKRLKDEVQVIYSALFEDAFQRHKEEQYVVDQADAEDLITISDLDSSQPAPFVSEHQMVAYITTSQLQTEVDQDYAANLNDFMKYARVQKKEKFAIAKERLAALVDEFIPAGEEAEEPEGATDTKADTDEILMKIVKDPKSVKKITRNILTHDQLMKAIETLVEHNSKFAVFAGEDFDAAESIQKIFQRAKVEYENIRNERMALHGQDCVDESDASSFKTDSEHSHHDDDDDDDDEGAGDDSEDEVIRAQGDADDDDDNSEQGKDISVDEVDELDAFNDVDESNIIDEAQLETREE